MDINDKQGWQKWEAQMPEGTPNLLQQLWEKSKDYKQGYQPDVGKGYAAFQQRVAASPSNQDVPVGKIVKMAPKALWLKVAASVILLCVSVFAWKTLTSPPDEKLVQSANDSQQLALPDGSEVTLNKSSELVYNDGFGTGERTVQFKGEGFFNIVKNPKKPFTIRTETAEITVLGTSFNVLSYPNDNRFEVYVETGKVKVDLNQSATSVTLGPGEYFSFDKTANKAKQTIDKSGLPIAWKTGVANFKGRPITEVLAGIELLFEIELLYEPDQFQANCLQSLTVHKGKFEEAIQALERSCQGLAVQKINDRQFMVTGNCCK